MGLVLVPTDQETYKNISELNTNKNSGSPWCFITSDLCLWWHNYCNL